MAGTKIRRKARVPITHLPKSPTGIQGLDEVIFGGLPRGRPSLVCGNAGCGKTLLAMEFLVRGARDLGEPGVFVSFEETEEDLKKNFTSLGFDVEGLIKRGKLAIEYIYIERSEIEETGEYDLEGLFVRLAAAVDSIGAKRMVLDTIEALFSGFTNEALLRAEIRRLFRWLKARGITAIVTGESGDRTLTRYGLEEYIADCVILLDHRIEEQISTRRLRVVKYRGSAHGTNEYPFLIEDSGISVLPITSVGLTYSAAEERIPTGIKGLDEMLGGKGLYRGSVVLISGSAGTGKTSIAAYLADSVCRRGQRCLYLAFEESQAQIIRDMASIGLNLKRWTEKGNLLFSANRPTIWGLEAHLSEAHRLVAQIKPDAVVIDPITDLAAAGTRIQAKMMLTRLIDFLRNQQVTTLATDLVTQARRTGDSTVVISSLADTWIVLNDAGGDHGGDLRIRVVKSRGMKHATDTRELRLTDNGILIREA